MIFFSYIKRNILIYFKKKVCLWTSYTFDFHIFDGLRIWSLCTLFNFCNIFYPFSCCYILPDSTINILFASFEGINLTDFIIYSYRVWVVRHFRSISLKAALWTTHALRCQNEWVLWILMWNRHLVHSFDKAWDKNRHTVAGKSIKQVKECAIYSSRHCQSKHWFQGLDPLAVLSPVMSIQATQGKYFLLVR